MKQTLLTSLPKRKAKQITSFFSNPFLIYASNTLVRRKKQGFASLTLLPFFSINQEGVAERGGLGTNTSAFACQTKGSGNHQKTLTHTLTHTPEKKMGLLRNRNKMGFLPKHNQRLCQGRINKKKMGVRKKNGLSFFSPLTP